MKVNLCHAMTGAKGSRSTDYLWLSSALDCDSHPQVRTPTPSVRGNWVGPMARVDGLEK